MLRFYDRPTEHSAVRYDFTAEKEVQFTMINLPCKTLSGKPLAKNLT